MGDRDHVRYSPLPTEERPYQQQQQQHRRRFGSTPFEQPTSSSSADDDNSTNDRRFDYKPRQRIPWKSIALALFLVSFGTFLLILSYLIFTAHLPGDSSQGWGFLVIGLLMFIPGFYETRLAYYAWRGSEGYSFLAIPEY